MTMYGTAPTWHTGWILPTAVTVIFLALVIAGAGTGGSVLDFTATPEWCQPNR